MPDLPEDQTPQEDSEISIELQFPVGIAEVMFISLPPFLSLLPLLSFLSLSLSSLIFFYFLQSIFLISLPSLPLSATLSFSFLPLLSY